MIKVTGIRGHDMPLVVSLLEFIANNVSCKFKTGLWIETLSEIEITTLKKQVKEKSETTCGIALTAYSAEVGKLENNFQTNEIMELLNMLFVIATIEEIRRKGFVVLLRILSIQPKLSIEYKITDKGKQAIYTETDSFVIALLRAVNPN